LALATEARRGGGIRLSGGQGFDVVGRFFGCLYLTLIAQAAMTRRTFPVLAASISFASSLLGIADLAGWACVVIFTFTAAAERCENEDKAQNL